MRRHLSSQSKKFLFKQRLRLTLITVGGIVVVSAALFTLSLVSSLDSFAITNVQVRGVDSDRGELIRGGITERISGKVAGLITRANIITFPKYSLQKMIKETYPEVARVRISRDGLHTITAAIEEKEMAVVVCPTLPDFIGKELSLDVPGTCYFADATGLIFKRAPSFSGNVYNRYYIPDFEGQVVASSSNSVIGSYATSTAEFKLIQKVYDGIKSEGISVDAVLFKANGEYELYARNPVISKTAAQAPSRTSTVVLYFNTISDPEEQVSNLISFWNHMVETARSKNQALEFDYIDARYGENVFYRQVN